MIEFGTNITIDPAHADEDCALAASLGLKWVRTSQEMHWTSDYSIARLTTFVDACVANGLRLIQCCQGMPASLSLTGGAGHFAAKDAVAAQTWGNWAALCCEVVTPCNGIVSIGNEWDNYGGPLTAEQAAVLMRASLIARDAIIPDAIMVTPELAPGSNPDQFLYFKDLCNACPEILTDSKVWMGWHPYTDPRYPANTTADWSALVKMKKAHNFLFKATGKHKTFMCGEWGLADGPYDWPQKLDPYSLARYVKKQYVPAFDQLKAQGVNIRPLIWYTLRDGYTGDGSWADHTGLYDTDGNPKPVADVIKAFANR